MATSASQSGIRTLIENLCTLEINTIVKPNLTGQKMPVPELALLDLAEEYAQLLGRYGEQITVDPMSPEVLSALRDGAQAKLGELAARAAKNEDYWLLARVRDQSDQLCTILNALRARTPNAVPYKRVETTQREKQLELLTDEIVVLRKAWELGLETVVYQTTIQLDGDVVHRVQEGYAAMEHKQLMQVHRDAVSTATEYWQTLVGLLGDAAGSFLRILGLKV